jgi:hypothetical protein
LEYSKKAKIDKKNNVSKPHYKVPTNPETVDSKLVVLVCRINPNAMKEISAIETRDGIYYLVENAENIQLVEFLWKAECASF